MAKYMCHCGMYLKSQRLSPARKKEGNTTTISYKVLIVKTERHYKCPNGCELGKDIKVFK